MMMKRFILTIERCWDKMKSSCMGYLWHLTWHNCTAFYYLFHLQKCVTKRQKRRRVTKLVHCNKMWWKVEEKNIRYRFTYKKEEKEQYVLNISKHKRNTNLYYTYINLQMEQLTFEQSTFFFIRIISRPARTA